MIPGELEVEFNLRYSPAVTHTRLRHRIEEILARHGLDYTIRWRLSGKPFITRDGVLRHTAQQATQAELGQEAKLSTAGGTSDGRFIAPTGAQVVELGPVNATIHRANECVSIRDLSRLAATYARILAMLLTGQE
jgi:succinyl-diaminopimelate desuccinylase